MALETLTMTTYDQHHQMVQFAIYISEFGEFGSSSRSTSLNLGNLALDPERPTLGSCHCPLYDMSGYGHLLSTSTESLIVHSTTIGQLVLITQINFLHSLSPLLNFSEPSSI
jgi:hypothetical protein